MRGNRGRDTRPELMIRRALHARGWRFRVDRAPLAELRCRADIVFASRRVAVFIDGCFWHGCAEHLKMPRSHRHYWAAKIASNIARDRRNDEALRAAGWTALRVWEHEPVEDAVAAIEAALRDGEDRVGTPTHG